MSIEDERDFTSITTDVVKAKILHVLSIYPHLSQSMLQVGIGTALSSKIWLPVFDDMKKEGLIRIEQKSARSPSGRDQTYQVISLNETK